MKKRPDMKLTDWTGIIGLTDIVLVGESNDVMFL